MNASGPDHRADRHRVVGVEHLARLERRQEGVDLLLVGHVDPLEGVGEDEAVHAHHHRQRELLGEPEGLDVQVDAPPGWTRRRAGSSRESRCDIASLWSFQMLIGAPIARLATVITIGSPSPEAL